MTQAFDPFSVSEHLRTAFLRYLREAHFIHESERDLRRHFADALSATDRFVREPLVSCIPSYRHAQTPSALFGKKSLPRLHPGLKYLDPDEFDPDRPLYVHQIQAIERIQAGRNVVVATGTGSGKTECFLLPILDHAMQAHEPGTTAIIIYPMNALANDQLDRMRRLVGKTPITFGRYTSQTYYTDDDIPDAVLREAKRPNEKLTRSEIRESPPQILLTNFAMLEYLLLRPQDQLIFRHPTVRYVVLDEAHTYSGAQGIDISLLMRRLQRQYPHKLQFVLTSATLGDQGHPRVKEDIAKFASGLCGSAFLPQDVVFGEVDDPFERPAPQKCTSATIAELAKHADLSAFHEAVRTVPAVQGWLRGCGLKPQTGNSSNDILYNTLRQVDAVSAAYDELRRQPKTVAELATSVFDHGKNGAAPTVEQREVAVRALLAAASVASPDIAHRSPLMSVRVHHFFRGLSGLSVSLEPSKPPKVRRVVLEDCLTDEETGLKLLLLKTCAHCGMPVVVVRLPSATKWEKPVGVSQAQLRLLTWFDPSSLEYENSDADDTEATEAHSAHLCLRCGAYSEGDAPDCGHEEAVELRVIHCDDRDGNLATCPCCGGSARPYPSVLRDFLTGEDAPTALLAEEIIRRMPKHRDDMPAGGRRLLAFSDSRQRAAYFTPYLTRTTAEPSYIQPLLAAARKVQASRHSPGTVVEVIDRAHSAMLEQQWVVTRRTDDEGFDRYCVVPSAQINPQEGRTLKHELALTLYEHLSASHTQRTKIGGLMLGAGAVEFMPAELNAARQAAPLLFADQQVGVDAIQRLLMYLIRRGAVEYWPETVTRAHIIGVGPTLVTVHRNPETAKVGKKYRIRWNPFEATKSRALAVSRSNTAAIVREVLRQSGDASDARVAETLNGLWEWLIANQRILRQVDPGEYQLPASRILLATDAQWYKCRRCNVPTIHRMTGACESPTCGGTVDPVPPELRDSELNNGHRAGRYLRDPMPLVVREHTAQLTLERGRTYQDEFKESKVNVLSSSTTFEMGVDVGQLQAVLLRNVPPTPANYIQRAGRAGRRRQGVAHAVTYARSVPHDQHHYFTPRDIVDGRVPVPVIYTANVRLTQRHVNSFLLGRFLREYRDQFDADNPQIGDFFPESETAGDAPADRFGPWCQQNRAKLVKELAQIIPSDCPLDAGEAITASAKALFSRNLETGKDTAYVRGYIVPLKSYQRQYEELQAEESVARKAKQLQKARALTTAMWRVDRLQDQLKEVHLIDFLAEQCWLPSYAFPQDVVKLKVRQEPDKTNMRLERDREVGISEYSPGSQVIADGKLFESVGVDLEKREPDLLYFRTSRQTRQIVIGHSAQEVMDNTKGMMAPAPLPFLEPAGFTTKHDAPALEPNLFRLKPPSNTEVFLLDGAPDSEFTEHPNLPGVTTGIHANAQLFRANLGKKGQGFMICLSCGLGLDSGTIPKAGHTTPWGANCRGRFERIALAHIFTTDVLQVRFPGHPGPNVAEAPFWFTLSTALAITACRQLSIDPKDLDSMYRSQPGETNLGELVLYDRVPGGAGHVGRIRENLPSLLRDTLATLTTCSNSECDPDSACYACLRSHRNQFQWANLKRSAPLAWLDSLCTTGR